MNAFVICCVVLSVAILMKSIFSESAGEHTDGLEAVTNKEIHNIPCLDRLDQCLIIKLLSSFYFIVNLVKTHGVKL